MAADDVLTDVAPTEVIDGPKPESEPTRKRPRLDLSAANSAPERKRGKSMFGIVLGTLNKAKIEDKERSASEAAKKRQLIEQRLQSKLRKETDSVRRAEEAKKNKTTANRKEEDLQLKDSIYKLRRTRLPLLANFLLTSDIITSDDSNPPSSNPLAPPPRTHPPPLYYLPAILTSEQETFLTRRKNEVKEATENEWQLFKEERAAGISEINELRQRAVDEEVKIKAEKEEGRDQDRMDTVEEKSEEKPIPESPSTTKESGMDVDEPMAADKEKKEITSEREKKEDPAPMQADDDDAVEY